MADQSNRGRLIFPHIIDSFKNNIDVARHCDAMGWTSDPVIDALVERLLKPVDQDTDPEGEVYPETNDEAACPGEGKPGPKDKYLPAIRAALQQSKFPLRKRALVTAVFDQIVEANKVAKKRPIYRAIDMALKNAHIKLDCDVYSLQL